MAHRLDGPSRGDRGAGKAAEVSHFDFATTKVTPIQIDGEVMHADANSQVVIACVSHALTTVG
jgi:hypothetical protein